MNELQPWRWHDLVAWWRAMPMWRRVLVVIGWIATAALLLFMFAILIVALYHDLTGFL